MSKTNDPEIMNTTQLNTAKSGASENAISNITLSLDQHEDYMKRNSQSDSMNGQEKAHDF